MVASVSLGFAAEEVSHGLARLLDAAQKPEAGGAQLQRNPPARVLVERLRHPCERRFVVACTNERVAYPTSAR